MQTVFTVNCVTIYRYLIIIDIVVEPRLSYCSDIDFIYSHKRREFVGFLI